MRQGGFRLSSVRVIWENWDMLVIEADCESKYPPGEMHIWSGECSPVIEITADGTDIPAEITLPGYVNGWVILTGRSKDGIRIACYRPKAGEEVWRHDVP